MPCHVDAPHVRHVWWMPSGTSQTYWCDGHAINVSPQWTALANANQRRHCNHTEVHNPHTFREETCVRALCHTSSPDW